MKIHNSMCLKHLSNSYRAFAAEIVNQNANLAVKLLDNLITSPPNNIVEPLNQIPPPRRRRFNDFLSGTDSSTEGWYINTSSCYNYNLRSFLTHTLFQIGEDNTMHSKMPRTRLGVGPAEGSTSGMNAGPAINISDSLRRSGSM